MKHEDNSLKHFGIPGMKWGIRRYQNSDGTLTAAGKKRYGSLEGLKRSQKNEAKKHRAASSFTESELKEEISRQKLEKEWNDRNRELNPTFGQKLSKASSEMSKNIAPISSAIWKGSVDLGKEIIKDSLQLAGNVSVAIVKGQADVYKAALSVNDGDDSKDGKRKDKDKKKSKKSDGNYEKGRSLIGQILDSHGDDAPDDDDEDDDD